MIESNENSDEGIGEESSDDGAKESHKVFPQFVTKEPVNTSSRDGLEHLSEIRSFKHINDELKNGVPPSKLQFGPDSKDYKEKREKIAALLRRDPISLQALQDCALSEGGLVDDSLRKVAWPLLRNLTSSNAWATEDEILAHPEYNQVVLDVERSLKRFPPGIPLEQRLSLQQQLTRLILRVLTAHRDLHYYQGYHDVAITLLLVTGEESAFTLLEHLSLRDFKDCMEKTIEKTSYLLNYIYPLIRYQNRQVYEHMENAGVGTVFALPWFITWFGHTLNHYKDVVRLYDYFLVTQPLAPIYLSSVIIAHRAKDILAQPCDMGAIHDLLSRIPDDLPFEKLLVDTTQLMKKYPPELVEDEVKKRVEEERMQREKDITMRKLRARNNPKNYSLIRQFLIRIDPVRRFPIIGQIIPVRTQKYIFVSAFAFAAVAFYLRSSSIQEIKV